MAASKRNSNMIVMVTRWFPLKLKPQSTASSQQQSNIPYPISANTKSLFLLSWGWTLPQIEDLILQCLLSAILAMLAAGVMLGRQLGEPGGYGWEHGLLPMKM